MDFRPATPMPADNASLFGNGERAAAVDGRGRPQLAAAALLVVGRDGAPASAATTAAEEQDVVVEGGNRPICFAPSCTRSAR